MNTAQSFRAVWCRTEIERCEEMIQQHEIMAAIPPAEIRCVELFTAGQLQLAQQIRVYASNLREELAGLEGQGRLVLSA